jgi:5'(3')-deoxyribonucleotidase
MSKQDATQKTVIFLDMDGVIVDFVRGCCNLFKVDYKSLVFRGHDFLHASFGYTYSAFWEAIRREGSEFWKELRPYPSADKIIEKLTERGRVVFCTSPIYAESLEGKAAWLNKWYPYMPFVMTRDKWLVAGPGKVLVDDRLENIMEFESHGGRGILFPRPWNPANGSDVWNTLALI